MTAMCSHEPSKNRNGSRQKSWTEQALLLLHKEDMDNLLWLGSIRAQRPLLPFALCQENFNILAHCVVSQADIYIVKQSPLTVRQLWSESIQ